MMNINETETIENWNTGSRWTLWFHSVKDNNWKKESYKKIFTINNLGDYQILCNILKKIHLQNCMLFLMKDDILPIWEDPENINGTSISFKITGEDILKDWNDIVLNVITNDIYIQSINNINGLSISPKKEFNIVKIWTKDKINSYKDNYKEYNKNICEKNVIIKPHK